MAPASPACRAAGGALTIAADGVNVNVFCGLSRLRAIAGCWLSRLRAVAVMRERSGGLLLQPRDACVEAVDVLPQFVQPGIDPAPPLFCFRAQFTDFRRGPVAQ